MWSTLSAKSRGNLERIIQNISSASNTDLDVPSLPHMESTMYQLQHGLPIGNNAGHAPRAPSYPPHTARVQAVPAPTHRTDQPPLNGGPAGPAADPTPSKAGESLARLR